MIATTPTGRWLASVIRSCYPPPPTDTLVEWCEKNVYLDRQSSKSPGWWRLAKAPWTKRVLSCAEDPAVRGCTVAKGSRSGGTEVLLNIIRSMPSRNPGHVVFVQTKDAKARNLCQRRLQPSLKRICPGYITGDPDDFGKSLIHLTNMEIGLHGSKTDSWGEEQWARAVFLDDYDSHEHSADQLNAGLARSRIRDVRDATVFIIGKCKLKGGPLHTEYMGGTQERYLVPCPHCPARFEPCEHGLKFGHLKDMLGDYDPELVLHETRYICPGCGAELTEADKRVIVQAAAQLENDGFIPAPESPAAAARAKEGGLYFDPRHPTREGGKPFRRPIMGEVSLRFSDFFCLHDDMTWGHMANKIIDAAGHSQRRKDLVIEHFGTGYGEAASDPEEEDIMRARGTYRRHPHDAEGRPDPEAAAELPWAPELFSLQADMQEYSIKWVKTAHRRDGEMAVIDWGEIGDHDFDILDVVLDLEHPVAGDPDAGTFAVDFGKGLIDSRYEEDKVFAYCVRSNFRLWPAKGIKQVASIPFAMQRWKKWIQPGSGGAEILVPAYHFNDHSIKDSFYQDRIARRRDPKVWFPADVDAEFAAELSAESKVRARDKFGMTVYEWKKTGPKNDWGDCCKMGLVVWRVGRAAPPAEPAAEPAAQ